MWKLCGFEFLSFTMEVYFFGGITPNSKSETCILRPAMRYFVKTPWWLKMVYPNRLWDIDTKEKIIYLTFDDGPHPVATPFVLDELKKYNARATFFCIGKNVAEHPAIFDRIKEEGHRIGNHTQHHLNGWKTDNNSYLADVSDASKYIESNLFRPPFGRLKSSQAKRLKNYKIVMWDILSGDFDESVSMEQCLQNVIKKAVSGSVVVFHDSEKTLPQINYCLPEVLKFFVNEGFAFGRI